MKFNKEGWLIECEIPFVLSPIPKSNISSRPADVIKATTITVHNPASKATAEQLSNYVDHTEEYKSWHFTIGQNLILQELPIHEKAYHAGDGKYGNGNVTSLSCEIQETKLSEETGIIFLRLLTKVLDIKVVPHKIWTGKNCPRLILPHWNQFIKEVEGMLTAVQKQTVLKAEGFYTGAIDGSYGPASQAAEKAFAEAKMEEIYNGNSNLSLEDQVSMNTRRIAELEKK